MPDVNLSILENFALKNWYRFLLYLGGVMLILSLFLEPKGIDIQHIRTFSFYTIILFVLVWIIDDILYKIGDFSEYENRNMGHIYLEDLRTLYIIRYIISFIALLVWSYFLFSVVGNTPSPSPLDNASLTNTWRYPQP